MEEIVTIDGKQYKLMYDRSLTVEQKTQAITDIRKQTGCGCGNKAVNLGIQKLQPPIGTYEQPFDGCIGVNILQPGPAITIQGVAINGTILNLEICGCYPSPCDPMEYCNGMITCPEGICTATITWINIGDVDGAFTPQITIDEGEPIMGDPTTMIVSAQFDGTPGMTEQSFFLPLSPGSHIICIDTGSITSPQT